MTYQIYQGTNRNANKFIVCYLKKVPLTGYFPSTKYYLFNTFFFIKIIPAPNIATKLNPKEIGNT